MKTYIFAISMTFVLASGSFAYACDNEAQAAEAGSCSADGHACTDKAKHGGDHHKAVVTQDGNNVRLAVQGMMCATCRDKISTEVKKIEGVKEISFKKSVATIVYADGKSPDTAALVAAVEKAGFKASLDTKKN